MKAGPLNISIDSISAANLVNTGTLLDKQGNNNTCNNTYNNINNNINTNTYNNTNNNTNTNTNRPWIDH